MLKIFVPKLLFQRRTYADSALTNDEWVRCFTDGPAALNLLTEERFDDDSVVRRMPRFDSYAIQDHFLYYADSRLYSEMYRDFSEPEWFVMTDRHVSLFITRKA